MSRKTRKLIWSAPLMAVLAVAGALALFVVLSPNETMAQDAQVDYAAGSPLNVTVVLGIGEAMRTSLVIAWQPPTAGSDLPITGYRIDQSTDGQRWTHQADVSATARSYPATGLKPATLRYYRVFAINRAGIGRVSEAKSETTMGITEPSEVQNFAVTATGPSSIKLDWDAPEDTGGARIIGYLIHWGVTDTIGTVEGNIKIRGTEDMDGKGDGIVPVLAPTTEWTDSGLDGSTTRHYKVYAVNWYDGDMTSKMTKDPTDVRSAVTMPPGKPAAPTGLTAVPVVARESTTPFALTDDDAGAEGYERAPDVNLYWYWPANNGGATISRFRIEVSKTGAWPDGGDTTEGTASGSITTLESDDFAVMMVAVNTAISPDSHQFLHTGAGRFLASPGDKLYYRVFAENGAVDDGIARRSLPDREAAQGVATHEMTLERKPAPVVPTDVNWVNETAAKDETHHHDSVNLSWDKPNGGNDPTSYRVDVAEGVDAPLKWKKLEPDTRHSDPTYDHLGWRPDDTAQTFRYRVFAKDGGLIGVASAPDANVVHAQTAPSPVQSLVSASVSANQIDLTWEEPEKDGGTEIVRYCVLATTLSVARTLPSTECTVAAAEVMTGITRKFIEAPAVGVLTERSPETMFMHKGLLASTTYRYRVYAINDAQGAGTELPQPVSPSSEEDPAETGSTVLPAAPTHLSAESALDSNFANTGARGVMVIWNGPADPAGAKVSGYEIQRKVNDGEFLLLQESSSRTTHYTDRSQPADDDVREYQIRARNTLGWGPWTATAVDFPLPASSGMPPAADELTAPSGVTVSKLRDTVSVTWDPASIENAAQVKVVLFDSGVTKIVDLKTFNAANDPGAATFTGVDSGTYKVTVASFRTGDRHKLSALMEVTIE